MPDLKRGAVKWTLEPTEKGGEPEELWLRYDMAALRQLEEVLGMKLDEMEKIDVNKVDFEMLLGFIWVGLQANHPEIERKDVGRAFLPQDLESARDVIQKAIETAMGGAEAAARTRERVAAKAKAGAGGASGGAKKRPASRGRKRSK